jgi:hypothetical protein
MPAVVRSKRQECLFQVTSWWHEETYDWQLGGVNQLDIEFRAQNSRSKSLLANM